LGSRATARAETCGSSRDRQFAEVEGIAFHYQFLPGCTVDALDRPVILAALAKARREHAGLDPHRGRNQPTIAGDVGDDRLPALVDVDDR
jgi:hypothetical protein